MSSLPDFEDTQIDADHLRQTSLVITEEGAYKRFEASRIGRKKVQANKLKEKHSDDAVSAVKVSTSKGLKGNGKSKETKAKETGFKEAKLQH